MGSDAFGKGSRRRFRRLDYAMRVFALRNLYDFGGWPAYFCDTEITRLTIVLYSSGAGRLLVPLAFDLVEDVHGRSIPITPYIIIRLVKLGKLPSKLNSDSN